AVVLFFMIISAQVSVRADKINIELLAETNRLEEEVLDGRKNLVRLTTRVDERRTRMSDLQEEELRLQAMIEDLKRKLSLQDIAGLAAHESVEELQAEIERLEAARKRLITEAREPKASGEQVRTYTGDGDRQYLTGLKLGGKRILFIVDASASMLGNTYINALLYRNMPDEMKLRTPKWRSTVDALDWITTRVSPDADFQVYAFNKEAWSVVEGSDGEWVPVGDGTRLSAAVDRLRVTVPSSGSNLTEAFALTKKVLPRPDNIYLLTDGLPTRGRESLDSERLVTPEKRVKFFNEARSQLPDRVPVNTLLFPMDGDPAAPVFFWWLAIDTKGSFMTPSSDWP
ncbi:MAG: hypothetical protein QGF91_02865, partial [Gammaproteobacteria bacterium]|nr:hypothetical protein [Gammaproteobacteria bacterium]